VTTSIIDDTLVIVAADLADLDLAELARAPTTRRRVLALTAVRPADLPGLAHIADSVVLLPANDDEAARSKELAATTLRTAIR
jgi:hypothetical protein